MPASEEERWRQLRSRLGEGCEGGASPDEIAIMAWFPRERTTHLTPQQQTTLDAVLLRLIKLGAFATGGGQRHVTPLVRHHIEVGNARPARAKLRRYSVLELETLWKEVDKLLRKGVIEPASSPWNSPLLLVPKPDGRLRVVQDLRAVNRAVTEHGDGMDGYPLPRPAEMHQALDRAVYFTTADALDGFWQVELDAESRPITAFQTRWGQFQWRVGTMGLMRMPATFQRLMELAIGHDALWAYALAYIDDVLVFSRTFDEHMVQVERVFTRLAQAGVVLKPSKCHFAQLQVRFLGHIVHSGGRDVDPAKVEAVNKLAPPRNVDQVRSYLQMASYYREYIPHFSDIAEPLNAALRKDGPRQLGDDVAAAWFALQTALRTAPLLAHPDYDGIRAGTTDLVLQTDASDVGLGGVLSQRRDGKEQPLAYYSRSLKKAERNYSVYDREALAAVEAILHFRPLLHNGRPFTLETDHAALQYILNPGSELRTKRQERYVTVLQEYPVRIVYRPGDKNANADAFSRLMAIDGGEDPDDGQRRVAACPFCGGQQATTAAASAAWSAACGGGGGSGEGSASVASAPTAAAAGCAAGTSGGSGGGGGGSGRGGGSGGGGSGSGRVACGGGNGDSVASGLAPTAAAAWLAACGGSGSGGGDLASLAPAPAAATAWHTACTGGGSGGGGSGSAHAACGGGDGGSVASAPAPTAAVAWLAACGCGGGGSDDGGTSGRGSGRGDGDGGGGGTTAARRRAAIATAPTAPGFRRGGDGIGGGGGRSEERDGGGGGAAAARRPAVFAAAPHAAAADWLGSEAAAQRQRSERTEADWLGSEAAAQRQRSDGGTERSDGEGTQTWRAAPGPTASIAATAAATTATLPSSTTTPLASAASTAAAPSSPPPAPVACPLDARAEQAAAEVVARPRGAPPVVADELAAAQRADARLGELMEYLDGGVLAEGDQAADRRRRERLQAARLAGFYISGGRLYTAGRRGRPAPEGDRLVVPRSYVDRVLAAAHDEPAGGGHVGFDRTYARITQRFFWEGMYSDTAEWVLKCPVCLARKMSQHTGLPSRGFGREDIRWPFEFVGVDVVGPFPRSDAGNLYIIVFTDYLTRWVEAFATPDHTAMTVARVLLDGVVARHGPPRVLLSDNGAEFRSQLLKAITELMGMERRFSSPYHPQCNGLTERANGSIVALLSMVADSGQRDWDQRLPMVLFSHRSAVNATFGMSPFRMLYGREAVLPFEAMIARPRPDLPPRWNSVADYVEALQEDLLASHALVQDYLMAQQYLREQAAAEPAHEARRYEPNERVWVYQFLRRKGRSQKLVAARWFGPYLIERRLPRMDTYVVRPDPARPQLPGPKLANPYVHAIRMRPYVVRAAAAPPPHHSSSDAPASGGDAGAAGPPSATVIMARDGPNVGRAFSKGMWLFLTSRFFAASMPGGGGVRPGEEVAGVVVHVDSRRRLLHVVCPRDFRADEAAFRQSLSLFLRRYSGDPLSNWREFSRAVLLIEVDGDDVAPARVADANATPVYVAPVDAPGLRPSASIGSPCLL